ncbi:damage-inducible protein DinB [Pseudomonas alcaligenes]|uniref:Damage-inducible protein DinB n=1 Tax=Aquipseudomonas alcaligenes TaxID=43263 RepID=A0ABR7RY99_AQUAC|nr:DinB family protein [Pseudomonas alcaligenes]MBC9249301.1 damage-inducible protein DinB [Pseudomonas alcaligenes]
MHGALQTHLQRLLAYHGWAYARLLTALNTLDEAQYRAPCGLFFGSIHGTLNHLAVVDRIWLARVRGEAPPFTQLDVEAVSERAAMESFLQVGVAAWHNQLDGLTDVELLTPIAYCNMAGEPFQRPLLDIVSHLVNHGTHHRGQITAALTALGQPAPKLDYIYALTELP